MAKIWVTILPQIVKKVKYCIIHGVGLKTLFGYCTLIEFIQIDKTEKNIDSTFQSGLRKVK